MISVLPALCVGFVMDLILGDPHWLPHPVQAVGWVIVRLEALLRRLFPKTSRGELAAGGVLVVLVCGLCYGLSRGLLMVAAAVHPAAGFTLECLMAWQVLATKSLRDAAMAVYRPLSAGDLPAARRATAMIVGRDTQALNEAGLVRATVETVSENTGDGIVAPLLFFALGGAPLAFLYKGINTMDSMVGYRSPAYLYFGRAAAKLDDAANYLPARLAGLLMVGAAWVCRLDARGAWRVLKKDRRSHKSPNAAWAEAPCAGALGLQLGGASRYGGVLVEKPTIGEDTRSPRPADILQARRLALAVAVLCFMLCFFTRFVLLFWRGGLLF